LSETGKAKKLKPVILI